MEIVIKIILVMIILELIELYLHKADTLAEMIEKLYGHYNKSIFIFFMIHPTLYFVLAVTLYFDSFNFYSVSILLLKTFDLFFKIEMIKQKYVSKSMDAELEKMMEMKMTTSMQFLSLILNVPFLYLSIFA